MDGWVSLFWCLYWLLAHLTQLIIALEFSSVTENINLQDAFGQIAAFADFNADKATDILVLNSTGSTQSLYLWSTGSAKFFWTPLILDIQAPVLAVQVGDFDGDGLVDLVTLSSEGEDCATARVHWITLKEGLPEVVDSLVLFNTSSSFLMTLDVNGDHVPDILATPCNAPGNLVFWLSNPEGKRSFSSLPLKEGERAGEGDYISGYYLELRSGCLPQLVILRADNEERWLDVWIRKGKEFISKPSVALPLNDTATSPLTYLDLNGDGVSEVVMLTCRKEERHFCTNASVLILELPAGSGCEETDLSLKLVKNASLDLPQGLAVPLEALTSYLVLGDLDLDSSPDLVIPVTNTTSNRSQLYFLFSVGSGDVADAHLQDFSFNNTRKLALFDLWEDGVLDLLVVSDGRNGPLGLSALKQSLGEDHTFLKVLVLSGHCYTDCSSGIIPYGSALTGASVAYSTTDRNSHSQQTRATTRPSTDPLQLPFLVFGLGQTPSFIEQLTVAAVYRAHGNDDDDDVTTGKGMVLKVGEHTWTNLVPNSQVIVIPNPPDRPGRWRMELYLTPSHLVFTTIGVLCALAVGLAILIILLHAREKYQDRQERKHSKHRFHFNAM